MTATFSDICERGFVGNLFNLLSPQSRLTSRYWAENFRNLTSEVTAFPGAYNAMRTPHMIQPLASMDDPDVPIIVARKSAQVAWSETQNNFLGRIIHQDPQNIIMAFPRRDSGKDYSNEKLKVLIRTTPELVALIGDPEKSAWNRFSYPGGFIKLITAASVSAMKSTSAPIIIVEEPDDLSADVKSQGDALEILKERQKTYEEAKLIYGGTPTDAGFSNVEKAYAMSNKMELQVACHACEVRHDLSFDNLLCEPYTDGLMNEIYGKYDPTTAHYVCPSCRTEWTLAQKNKNIEQTVTTFENNGWQITAPHVLGIHGFSFNELLSPFPASTFQKLAEKRCKAELALEQGSEGLMKSFTNNQKGLAYSKKLENLDAETLKGRALDYPELVIPIGGLVLTMGVDVQHNRLAVIIRAWGRQGNSWLVFWGEIFGDTQDKDAKVWVDLEEAIFRSYKHAVHTEKRPIYVPISGVSIDSSDNTEVVYSIVKRLNKRMGAIFATKGSSDTGKTDAPIFNTPAEPDADSQKAGRKKLWETMGINVFIVGTQRAKDEVYRRARLVGATDRHHIYKTVRRDYYDQLLSNVKRRIGIKERYDLPAGKRDEVLDCECLALHATYALGMPNWDAKVWQSIENSIIVTNESDEFIKKPKTSSVAPGLGIK